MYSGLKFQDADGHIKSVSAENPLPVTGAGGGGGGGGTVDGAVHILVDDEGTGAPARISESWPMPVRVFSDEGAPLPVKLSFNGTSQYEVTLEAGVPADLTGEFAIYAPFWSFYNMTDEVVWLVDYQGVQYPLASKQYVDVPGLGETTDYKLLSATGGKVYLRWWR